MTDKEKIIIDGVDVSQCEFYIYYSSDRYPHRCGIHKDMFGMPACCDVADCCKNCYFKQLQEEKFENLNNRQMVESAENLIYENSELYKNLKEKEQECEKLKKQLMQKSEVDMFFNTPIEGWSNDPCGICPHKAENEELLKENQQLRNSLSDSLMFRFTSQDKEADRYRKALEEIEDITQNHIINDFSNWNMGEISDDIVADYVTANCKQILDIINKAKDGE